MLILLVAFGPLIRMEGSPAPPSGASLAASSPPTSTLPSGELFTLRGNIRPEAMNPANDRGPVSDDLQLPHLQLLLQRSAAQEQALEQFIDELHDPKSPLFHHWISAAEFGQTYGVAPADIALATNWLESQGFQVNLVYPSRMVIDFTGTAGQIRQAFHTEIHNLMVNGQPHIANISDPMIPLSLAAIIKGIVSLNDFRPKAMHEPRSQYTVGGGTYLLTPPDLWTIYNFTPVFTAGYSGQGQTIAIIQDSDLYSTSDWGNFRSTFDLNTSFPSGSLTTVHPASSPVNNCADPGFNIDDDGESALDVEWSSAAAPNAAIELASCNDTNTTFGGFLALQNLLNGAGMPPAIMSVSFGQAETYAGAAYLAFINSIYQQGVTEGVSIFVSAGDAGAATADQFTGAGYVQSGITVNGWASTPYNVAVGGTDFGDSYLNQNAAYWNSTNSATYGSALSYMPEIPWNDSCASVLAVDYASYFYQESFFPTYGANSLCNSSYSSFSLNTAAGGGGPSACATGVPDILPVVGGTCAGYPKPSWQSGFIGNPSDGVRDLPDVSLFASDGFFWGHAYVYCFTDAGEGGMSCSKPPYAWAQAGGTSFASPIMAGIQALINQATSSTWGNPNPAYYALAAEEYGATGTTTCTSSLGNTVAANCVFYDLTQIPLIWTEIGSYGADTDLPCKGPDCYSPEGSNYGVLSTTSASYQPAFTAATGWDFATGIGTVNVSNLVSSFTSNTASLSSSGLDFSAAPGNTSAAQNATMTNTGTGSMIILSDSITGTDAGDFTKTTDTCAGATLAHNQSCSVSLTFTAPSMGTFNAALNFTDIAPHSPQSVSLTGTGAQPGPVASLSTNSLTFQPVPVGSASTQPVTLSNTGTNSLALSAITVSGYFAQTNNCGTSLTAGANCTINVTFQPRGPGASTGALTVSDNASGSPQTVALNGTGVVFTAGPNPPVIAPPPAVPQPGNPSPAPKADPLKGKPIKEEPIGQTPPKSD